MCVGSSRTAGSIQGGPISTETRVNERIRVPEVRLIGPGGEQVGIVRIEDALRVAADADLDLVEVAPNARPPVCKIMDYGKYKYEQKKKKAESKKRQHNVNVKEVRVRPKTGSHDIAVKVKRAKSFLEAGDKVQLTVLFRGREVVHSNIGIQILGDIAQDLADIAKVERPPRLEGKRMHMILSPSKAPQTKKGDAGRGKSEGKKSGSARSE